jgi:hypothetical protein
VLLLEERLGGVVIYYYAVENLVERNIRGNQDVGMEIGRADLNLTELAKEGCLQSRELLNSARTHCQHLPFRFQHACYSLGGARSQKKSRFALVTPVPVFSCKKEIESEKACSYEAYSEIKYRLRIFPSQRWGRNFAHARFLSSFTGKPQKPVREK